MPWDGSGNFTRGNGVNSGATTWQDDASSVEDILADRHDTHDEDLADGIHACLAKNGENAATADLDIGSNKLTNVAAGTASTDAATIGGSETLTNKTLTSPTIQGGTIGSSTVMDSAKITEINQYVTDTLSPTGSTSDDYGRLCRITLNAQGDTANIKLTVLDSIVGRYSDFFIKTRQNDALNNDPDAIVYCTHLDTIAATGGDVESVAIDSIKLFYTVSATESYIDVYFENLVFDDRVFGYQFSLIETTGSAAFTAYNAETATDADTIHGMGGSFDVTSVAGIGLVVYDQALDPNGSFTGNGWLTVVKSGANSYLCTYTAIDVWTHSSSSGPATGTGFIPSTYCPTSGTMVNLYQSGSDGVYTVGVATNGQLSTAYRDYTGTLVARTSIASRLTITWTGGSGVT